MPYSRAWEPTWSCSPESAEYCERCGKDLPDYHAVDPEEGFVADGVKTGVIPAHILRLISKLPTVREASPFLWFRLKDPLNGRLFTIGGFNVNSELAVATTACQAKDITSGRFLNRDDKGAVLLEEAYAMVEGLKVGSKVMLAGEPFTVVGIVQPGIRPAKTDIYMPIGEAYAVINSRTKEPINDTCNVILVEVANSTVQEQAFADIRQVMDSLVLSSYSCYKPAVNVIGINSKASTLLMVVIGLCILIFAMKTQMSSVIERRHDIAVLKAIGWSNGSVMLQVLTESMAVAIVGGVLGCLVATVLIALAPGLGISGIPPGARVPFSMVAGFLLALGGGLLRRADTCRERRASTTC